MKILTPVLAICLALYAGSALAACYEPRAPIAPAKSLKPAKPRPPYCMGATGQRNSCSDSELRQYDQDMSRYNRGVEDYVRRLRQYATDANRYAGEVSKYVSCETQEMNR